ncbi:hypothetical protein SD70_24850 [Gordoniibacillus kamchatkensis]|uniref:Bacterial Ig-like domain-containing protein n=1 Tax=Gordoniibacillus kamchatkensis TaxID=1590651 RepID=A0ABR5AC98_9BACL|nr:Ig-like domain-containing protein [Paenibacillus sp. VKM B-2647]KIL38681.1 hypothetical protein SD70_24850 [Paenibacillus sp. VKM B-2647]
MIKQLKKWSLHVAAATLIVSAIVPIMPEFAVTSHAATTQYRFIFDQFFLTNKDVHVTIQYPNDAVVRQYRIDNGAWQNYSGTVTMTQNGTVYARSQDASGNWYAEDSYEVTNIDKTPPTTPIISISDNVLTIQPGTDAQSGVIKTFVSVNGGAWTAYVSPLTLTDGSYTVEVKTVDNAGNTSGVAAQAFTMLNQTVTNDVTNEVAKAESSATQADVDAALALVNALPNSQAKTDLLNRLNVVQQEIDAQTALDDATVAVENAEIVKTQAAVDAAKAKVNAMPDGQTKTELLSRLDAIQQIIDTSISKSVDGEVVVITLPADATSAVAYVETVKTQAALDSAKAMVNSLA